jgi:hypothetical protein
VQIRSIKAWWVFAAFLSGMALAMIAEDLILSQKNNRLEFSAPRTDFFAGQPMVRLKNALEVPFVIRTTLYSGTKTHVYTSAVDQFVVSFDIFQETYSVAKTASPRKSASHLTAKAAQAWCLSQMSLDTSGLSGSEPLWARLEIRAEDPARDGNWIDHSVNQSGISLLPFLTEFLGRPGPSQPVTLESEQFTLDQMKSTRGS